jgi:hypothetical protein
LVSLLCTTVIAYVISASGGVGFDLDVRDVACLVCHRQCGGEDNSACI